VHALGRHQPPNVIYFEDGDWLSDIAGGGQTGMTNIGIDFLELIPLKSVGWPDFDIRLWRIWRKAATAFQCL
jgi:hypothetical protein